MATVNSAITTRLGMTMSVKAKVEFEIDVDQDWIDMLVHGSSVFATNQCGYWMYGMEHSHVLGWLCFEHDEETIGTVSSNPEYKHIVKLWKEGKPLPEKWFRLNLDAATKAYAEGCKRAGINWYEHSDATEYDIVIQMVLLGEVRYG